jgi:hypothetical protein
MSETCEPQSAATPDSPVGGGSPPTLRPNGGSGPDTAGGGDPLTSLPQPLTDDEFANVLDVALRHFRGTAGDTEFRDLLALLMAARVAALTADLAAARERMLAGWDVALTRAEDAERVIANVRALADEFAERSDAASRRELTDSSAYARRVVWDTAEQRLRALLP